MIILTHNSDRARITIVTNAVAEFIPLDPAVVVVVVVVLGSTFSRMLWLALYRSALTLLKTVQVYVRSPAYLSSIAGLRSMNVALPDMPGTLSALYVH